MLSCKVGNCCLLGDTAVKQRILDESKIAEKVTVRIREAVSEADCGTILSTRFEFFRLKLILKG
jgi:hypothetical protein